MKEWSSSSTITHVTPRPRKLKESIALPSGPLGTVSPNPEILVCLQTDARHCRVSHLLSRQLCPCPLAADEAEDARRRGWAHNFSFFACVWLHRARQWCPMRSEWAHWRCHYHTYALHATARLFGMILVQEHTEKSRTNQTLEFHARLTTHNETLAHCTECMWMQSICLGLTLTTRQDRKERIPNILDEENNAQSSANPREEESAWREPNPHTWKEDMQHTEKNNKRHTVLPGPITF